MKNSMDKITESKVSRNIVQNNYIEDVWGMAESKFRYYFG